MEKTLPKYRHIVRRNVRRVGVVLLVAAAAMLTQISPASAAGSGVTHNGESNIHVEHPLPPPGGNLCLQANSTTITLFNTGTFTFGTSSATETKAVWTQTDTTYYFGPGGTYSDSNCQTLASVGGSLTVTDKDPGGGTLTCTSTATYQRTGSSYVITTTGTGCGSLSFTGTQLACSTGPADPCGSGPSSVEFTGNYTQT